MTPLILGLVLAAAAMHATWNALIKSAGDPLVRLGVLTTVGGLCGGAMLAWGGWPVAASWGWLALSVAAHLGYNLALVQAYRFGDLSVVYPLARGIAPLLVAAVSVLWLAEPLPALAGLAVGLMCVGILSLAWQPRRLRRSGWPGVAFALLTGCFIALYTISDGLGGRAAGSVAGYIGLLFLLDGVVMAVAVAALRRGRLVATVKQTWATGSLAGVLSFTAYAVVIWAMSVAPIAHVAALRESSVIMAALIGVVGLREAMGGRRIVAALAVAAGIVLLRFANP